MRSWTVVARRLNGEETRIPVEDAADEWRAILAAGRTGRMPLDARTVEVLPFPDAPRWGMVPASCP